MLQQKSLSTSYWVAFTILALWAAFAYGTMYTLIASQQSYGKLINLSGKQRMLSQRTALFAHLSQEHEANSATLIALMETMRQDHGFITSHLPSQQLENYYFGRDGLDGKVRRYLGLLEGFAHNPSQPRLETITQTSTVLLGELNGAVSIFEEENSAIVDKLAQRELLIFLGTLVTLILEAMLIIRPMIVTLKRYLKSLETEVGRQTKQIRIFSNIFKNAKEGMVIADADHTIREVNDAYLEIMGYAKEEIVGQTLDAQQLVKQDRRFYENIWATVDTRHFWQGEIVNRKKDGSEVYEHMTIMKLVDNGTANYISVISDISERVSQEKELHYLANHDSLTGLFNRSEILNRIEHAAALADQGNRHLAVVFIDLDNFKVINDSLGHALGDRLLVAVSKRLTEAVSEPATLGRLGGDEFVVLIEGVENRENVQSYLETLHDSFETPFHIDGKSLTVGASVGVAYYPDGQHDGVSAERLIRKADLAMYHAKELGKNRIAYYNDDLQRKIQSRLLVKHRLAHAIEEGELTLFLQPQVDIASGAVIGAEALVRWYRDGQLISPVQFIAVAEENALIKKIDLWALEKTIAYLEAMKRIGHAPFRISLNVSGRTFSDAQMIGRFITMIRDSEMASQIELEITERTLVENLLFAAGTVEKIRQAGMRVVLDDFGTGYSSFSYLGKMPLDAIKIDRSFIGSLEEPRQKILVEAMITFSDKLGMEVIAEGIETASQLQWLRQQKCDVGQGYYFGKPVAFETFLEQLER